MSENDIEELRSRFAREAMALMERTGEEVTRTRLAAELKVARARVETVFPEEGDLLEIRLTFPQCWDGQNLDSTNHKSHMAYARQGQAFCRVCPAMQKSHNLSN